MTEQPVDRGPDVRLVEVEVADPPEAWAAAGFAVEGDRVRVGATTFRLTGPPADGGRRGIRGWTLSGLDPAATVDGILDGLPTRTVDPTPPAGPTEGGAGGDAAADAADLATTVHPNGTTGLDHVVVLTPDLDRTLAALAAVGLQVRRIRDTTSYGSPMRQAFLRLGPTILEVVSGDTGSGAPASEAPAAWFGLAVDVDDLDATAHLLGAGLGGVKVAVQPGRRIATFRHKDLGLSVAIAAMDHHADRVDVDDDDDDDAPGAVDQGPDSARPDGR